MPENMQAWNLYQILSNRQRQIKIKPDGGYFELPLDFTVVANFCGIYNASIETFEKIILIDSLIPENKKDVPKQVEKPKQARPRRRQATPRRSRRR